MTDRYTYEPHSDGFALYDGRVTDGPLEGHRHGYNLANMRGVDSRRLDVLLIAANEHERFVAASEELHALLADYDAAVDHHSLTEAREVDDVVPVLESGSLLAGAVRRLLNPEH